MASENNEISEIVKKCKILLLDIEGTTTSISFVKDKLFPYAEANVKEFLDSQWENEDVKEAVAALRKLAIEDEEQKVEGVVTIPGEDAAKDEQIEGLVKSVKWQMSADRKAGPLKQLQGLIWKQGYDKGDIKGHVYDDVAPALALWNSTEGQKVYIYSSGSVQAQKLLFNRSAAGDLLPHIEGHFDTAVGAKQEAASYVAIAEKIGCKPEEILFLTDIVKEAEAARASGLQVALVSREGNAPLSDEATSSYPVLQSFDQLTISNKRKPEPQESEVPAKVLKTDVEVDVKTASEIAVPESTTEAVPETVASEAVSASETITETTVNGTETEKMEVEEETPVPEAVTDTDAKEVPVHVETVIEEVTTSPEVDAPEVDVNPVIIEEIVEKTDKMETEPAENTETVETASEPKEQEKVEQTAQVAEVEIEDVTNDQEIINEGIELDDVVPVVEEPPAVEMDDLNNVADVLDKECDEILLKVHDVTNLDNIPVKPLLSSIAEEDIGAENGENTNDIVDSILDSEMELGDKPCENFDANVVQEISDTKVVVDELKTEEKKLGENKTEVNRAEERVAESFIDDKVVDESSIEVEKVAVSSSGTITEVITEESAAPSNKDTQGVPTDIAPEAKPATVAQDKLNEVTTEVGVAETKENETASEDSAVIAIGSKVEIKEREMEVVISDSTEEPVDNAKETEKITEASIKTNESIEEELDRMESEETVEVVKNKIEVNESSTIQLDEEKTVSVVESEEKMESEVSVPQEKATESIAEPETKEPESKVNDNETTESKVDAEAETKKNTANDVQMETEAAEKVNGNMNGDTEVNQNGVASKEEELSARLSVENGDTGNETNGANGNGDSSEMEMGQGDSKVEAEIPDIKVKTVSTEETRTDPIEQPVEA